MSQNRSSAVMAQRHAPPEGLDYYPTPPWATRALCERLSLAGKTVWEPACGELYMARPLAEYAGSVIASDIFDYGVGAQVIDFLSVADDRELFPTTPPSCDWVITNPPFRLLTEFLERALKVSKQGVAFFARTQALEGNDRYERFFSRGLLTEFHQFVERVALVGGRVDPDAASASAYAWFVFEHSAPAKPPLWIAPCRARLERPHDYAKVAA